MKTHRISLLVAVLMLLAQLVGCGSGGGSSSPAQTTTSASPSPSPTTLTLIPPVAAAAPGANITFTTLNFVGAPVFAFNTNASGGTLTAGGLYTAGPTGHVTDIVQVTDSKSNTTIAASVLVSPVLTVTPPAAAVNISGQVTLAASGGSGSGYTFSLFRNASGGAISNGTTYTAGPQISCYDIVAGVDSAQNINFSFISVGSFLAISSASGSFSVAPQGSLSLAGAGGTGNYSWFYVSNLSGGTLNQNTGAYTAGPNGGVSDVVLLLDSAQHIQVAVITVGASLSITPATPSTKVKTNITFAATGGTGTGLTWAITTNNSGGSINPATGAYTAGQIGNVTDTVTVTDSNGATATTTVTVTP